MAHLNEEELFGPPSRMRTCSMKMLSSCARRWKNWDSKERRWPSWKEIRATAQLKRRASRTWTPSHQPCFESMPGEDCGTCQGMARSSATALETSMCDEAYEKVKEVALRLERSLKTAEECRLLNKGKTEIRYRHRALERRREAVGGNSLDSCSNGSERVAKPLTEGEGQSRSINGHKKNRGRDFPRCYNCGNMGHLAKDCRSGSDPQQRTPSRVNAQRRPDVAYASLVEKWVCTS
ncbi:unnamed protein product [Haemonchus placei]|uniref:CCHC-type domain-containing protein n=1 Tax=Haemonchus placei TaxID=6290 RepID=A0A0N4X9V2_HAEPC|nr:unnamed protein product [Haemonchus placei]